LLYSTLSESSNGPPTCSRHGGSYAGPTVLAEVRIFLNLGVLAAPSQAVLLCNKSAIATESTISFVADPGNAPLRSPVEAEERDRRSQPQVSTAAAPTLSSVASTACTARFPFYVPLPSLLAISATIWARTLAGDFMHAAIFWDAALMPVKCSMTYINKEADIQISLARLILPWAGSPALRCGRFFFCYSRTPSILCAFRRGSFSHAPRGHQR